MKYKFSNNRWLDILVEEITQEYEDLSDEGIIGCTWHTWRASDTINKCNKEMAKHCGSGRSNMKCVQFLSKMGVESLSGALFKCIQKRDPDRFAKLLGSCSSASLKRLLK